MSSTISVADLRWWNVSDQDVPRSLVEMMRRVMWRQSPRQESLLRAVRLFGNAALMGLSPQGMARRAPGFGALSFNIVKAVSLAAHADLVRGPAPRPMFVTNGGDFSAREQAEGLTKFGSGLIYENKFDRIARGCALHSAVCGVGISKAYEDQRGNPRIERALPWEVHVDDRDAYNGEPRCIYHLRWVDRAVLGALYPDKKHMIEQAQTMSLDGLRFIIDKDCDQVPVIEAWHLRSGPDEDDGRHVLAVSNGLLLSETYSSDNFPFSFFHWTPPLSGFWSPGIGEDLAGIQYTINKTLMRMDRALDLGSAPKTWLPKGSAVSVPQLNNEIMGVVHYSGNTPPLIDVARVVSPELGAHLSMCWQKGFEMEGVSQPGASSLVPQGIKSGAGIRLAKGLQSARFADWCKAFPEFYVETTDRAMDIMHHRSEEGGEDKAVTYLDPSSKSPAQTIRWSEVKLDRDSYVMQCFPVSSLPSDPEGRQATLDEWLDRGAITMDTYKEQLQILDTEAEIDLTVANRKVIKRTLDAMIRQRKYSPPEAFDNLQDVIQIAAMTYSAARLDDVPDDRLELIRTYIAAAQDLDKKAKAAAAPPPAPALPPGPPGAPPSSDPMGAPLS